MKLDNYVTPKDIEDIKNASNFDELLVVAQRILTRMPEHVVGVCDPISNHPAKAISKEQETIKIKTLFAKTVEFLIDNGFVVFDDRIFFKKINELKEKWFIDNPGKERCSEIVDTFFKPLLATKKIKILLLLPDLALRYIPYWESTHAAALYDIKVLQLPYNWEEKMSVESIADFKLPRTSSSGGVNKGKDQEPNPGNG